MDSIFTLSNFLYFFVLALIQKSLFYAYYGGACKINNKFSNYNWDERFQIINWNLLKTVHTISLSNRAYPFQPSLSYICSFVILQYIFT